MSRASVLSVNAASGSEPRVRLADLVAALSLGVDLGFGQPMEHVLRQCMIALRLAETVGLDEDGRSVVYYTALLVNVGCHSDAHEQAKWFGDDIALAGAAGAKVGLSGLELVALRRAGVVHGWGRLGVSNAIWDKRGTLGAGEWERVRMHPYFTERMLCQSAVLAPLGAIAAALRERLDGSGYPRRLAGAAVPLSARVLGAADAYQSMCEPRPYRDVLRPERAAAELRAEVKAGRMDGDVVEAVLGAAGHRVARRREGPAGLTAREVDVLRLVSRGLSSKEVAARLVISPKTARNHIEHIYAKIGVSNRAGASLGGEQDTEHLHRVPTLGPGGEDDIWDLLTHVLEPEPATERDHLLDGRFRRWPSFRAHRADSKEPSAKPMARARESASLLASDRRSVAP